MPQLTGALMRSVPEGSSACAPMLAIDHDHRKIAVAQTIADASGEADDLGVVQGNYRALRVLDELREMFAGTGSVSPAVLAEEQSYRLHFVRPQVAYAQIVIHLRFDSLSVVARYHYLPHVCIANSTKRRSFGRR